MANFATRDNVKTFLGITSSTDDTLIDSILDRTTLMIKRYCGRDLEQTTYTDERHDGDGIDDSLLLRNWPIISVASVYDDPDRLFTSDSLLTANEDYVVQSSGDTDNPGVIRRIDSVWLKGIQNIKVAYTAGYTTTPVDLVQAQVDWTSFLYKNRDMRIGISSYRLGAYSVNFKENTAKDSMGQNMGVILPPDDVRMVLDYYRDPRMESTS